MAQVQPKSRSGLDHRYFIGGSDARIIIGDDESALRRVWREKRGEVEPEDLSGNLVVQRGLATEGLNRRWYGCITGRMTPRYIVALCYTTAVILLGWWPWNILLILPALASGNHNRLRFSAFVTPEESVRSKLFCLRGGSL
jgi:hypothetical protein